MISWTLSENDAEDASSTDKHERGEDYDESLILFGAGMREFASLPCREAETESCSQKVFNWCRRLFADSSDETAEAWLVAMNVILPWIAAQRVGGRGRRRRLAGCEVRAESRRLCSASRY